MNWSPSMIQKLDVYMKVQKKYPNFITCYYDVNNGSSVRLGMYKMAPEEIQLLVKAAIKFSKLVIL